MDVVLLEYGDKSHNFTNLIFYDVITSELYGFVFSSHVAKKSCDYVSSSNNEGTIKKACRIYNLLIFNVFNKYSESSYHTDEYLSIINSQFKGLNDRTKLGKQNIRVQRILIFT